MIRRVVFESLFAKQPAMVDTLAKICVKEVRYLESCGEPMDFTDVEHKYLVRMFDSLNIRDTRNLDLLVDDCKEFIQLYEEVAKKKRL